MDHIHVLGQPLSDIKLGGKGQSLARMSRAGFRVPQGFVINAQSDIQEIADAILESFDNLGSPYVAVRSSASSEDSAEAAWAGQLETYLYVTRDQLLSKITACRNSISSERARAYAEQRSLAAGPVAVVVQRMIPSDISGIAFSAHPVTGSRDHVVIEAGFGLGEALVSGQITPDNYIIHKTGAEPLQKHIARQTRKLEHNGSNVSWVDIADGYRQKLSDDQIAQVSTAVQKLQAYFGHPVDVEWAIADSKLYILQSRPITTL
jgi:phosphoenolpyruvate synthase/pyruvate phosphate dikinase